MQITKELLQKQGENFLINNDGVKQGYIAALNWVAATLEVKEEKVETANAEIVK